MPNLLLICGALRQGSLNRKLLIETGQLWSGETVMADLDMPLYNGDIEEMEGIPEAATRVKRQIEAADAVAISTPEYNQSISGAPCGRELPKGARGACQETCVRGGSVAGLV